MHGNATRQPTKRWASNEVEALRAGFAAGLDDSQLIAETGRTLDGIASQRHKLQLFRPHKSRATPWVPALVEKLRELAHRGLSGGCIGEQLGFTRAAIIGKCDREGIALHGKVRFTEKLKRVSKRRKHIQARSNILDFPKITKQLRAPRQITKVLSWKKSEVVPLRVSLTDLQFDLQCHQIVDGETDDNCMPICCGHPIFKRSYCFEHYRENHQGTRVNA